MKKILLLFTVSILFTQCSKDGDSESLNGTTWKSTQDDPDYKVEAFFEFGKTTVFMSSTYSELINGSWETGSTQNTGIYVYDPPVITITINGETETGTVSGREMTFVFEDEVIIFTQQ
ncbi:MAG: hypothetical protein LBC19_01590 [Tannerella sp.]|jgi:hypothetical protein|nr:hypothetical protein [Tannerella sp.]